MMGRRRYGSPQEAEGRIYAERIRLDRGGYDSYGSYWGTGERLYKVYDAEGKFEDFVRASSAKDAKNSFGLGGSRRAAIRAQVRGSR